MNEPTIQNSSQLLIYQSEDGVTRLEVQLQDETVWLSQKHMAGLFQTTVPNINLHLKNIFAEGELVPEATIKDFLIVQDEGSRLVKRSQKFYNLDAIISVGYRIKSHVATRFRQWATIHIREFIVKGFVLDDERLKNPDQPFDYFDELLRRIQDIRTSEKRYQGKQHMTSDDKSLGISPWCPYQLIIELTNTLNGQEHGFRLSGSICYDATDIAIAADLKDVTNAYILPALNQDINTFDTMVDALHYHMYQPVILVNSGQFGGSAAKALCKEKFHKLIAHGHGNNQIAISMFELNMYDFGEQLPLLKSGKEKKTAPAGLKRAGTISE